MWKLRRYLKGYEKESLLSPLFKLLEAALELLVPLVMAAVVDRGVGGDRAFIWRSGGLLIAMGLFGLAAAITAQYFSAKAAAGFGTALRDDLFSHILSLSRADTDRIGRATLITRTVSDSNQIQTGVNLFFRLVLRSPFIVFGAMLMAWRIDAQAGLLLLAVIAVLSVIVFVLMRATVSRYRTVQKKTYTLLGKTAEHLTGVRVLRAFRREAAETEDYDAAANALFSEQLAAGRISALMNPLTYVVVNLGLAALLQTGAVRVDAGALTRGDIVALVNYISQILVELLKLANLILVLSKSEACARRVNEVFAMDSTMADGALDARAAEPAVEFDHVGFTYPGAASESLTDLTFRAAPGETVGVIGGTGSGKTTLGNLIPRFYDATSGTVRLGGQDVRRYTLASLRQAVGVVEQSARLFSGTIAENLRWGGETASDDELRAALATAQAAEVADGKGGLGAEVEQLGRNFSGGQKQRLSIARTLARKPAVLILDDSSSALDFATDAALRRALREDCRGITVFLISQRVSTIRNADRILVLDDGRLAGSGTHAALLETCPIYREICLSQGAEQEASK